MRGLQVAQHRVDRLELRQLDAGLAAAGDDALVLGADQGGARKHHRPSETTVGGRASDSAANIATASLVNGCWRKHATHRLAVVGGLHRGDERHLVLRAAAGLAARALAAEVGVVDLHPAVELAARPRAGA